MKTYFIMLFGLLMAGVSKKRGIGSFAFFEASCLRGEGPRSVSKE